MSRSIVWAIVMAALWLLLATACGAGTDLEAVTVTLTLTPAPTLAVTTTAAGSPTAAEAETPAAASFNHFTTQAAIDGFRAAGLEVEAVAPFVVDGHSPLPPTFVEAQQFQIPALAGRVARLFSFEREGDLQAVESYYEGFDGPQASHLFVRDNLLLQIPVDLPAEMAAAYGAALAALEADVGDGADNH